MDAKRWRVTAQAAPPAPTTTTDQTATDNTTPDQDLPVLGAPFLLPMAITNHLATTLAPRAGQLFNIREFANQLVQQQLQYQRSHTQNLQAVEQELDKLGIVPSVANANTMQEFYSHVPMVQEQFLNYLSNPDVYPPGTIYGEIRTTFEQKIQQAQQAQDALLRQKNQAVQNQQQASSKWSIKVAQVPPIDMMGEEPPMPDLPADPNQAPEGPGPSPISQDMYSSMDELKEDLISQGPSPDLYNKILQMVGPDNEDDAKDALVDFFQGVPGAVCAIYDMLVEVGIASPIDKGVLENLMQQHPELNPQAEKDPEQSQKVAGLFLPKGDAGLSTTDAFVKTASGGIGSTSPQGGYLMNGPNDVRFCPKIRNQVSTFTCRYHCLDGLKIDDQVVCGEALWRKNVMDKFSRETRDADGNQQGGYINDRFVVDRSTGGHPYQLKPGERTAPIHEDAWSTEKRLSELRQSEGPKRGWSKTSGNEEGLYNFDQHELAPGPKAPQLFLKKKDPIAKLASSGQEQAIRVVDADEMMKMAGDIVDFWGKSQKNYDTDDIAVEALGSYLKEKYPTMHDLVGVKLVPAGSESFKEATSGFNLSKNKEAANFNLEPQAVDSGRKMCPHCGVANSAKSPNCHKCHGDISRVPADTVATVMNDTGSTFKMDPAMNIKANSDFTVHKANGVYVASVKGSRAYSDSYQGAVKKLAQKVSDKNDIDEAAPLPIEEEEQALLNVRNQMGTGKMPVQKPVVQGPGQVPVPQIPGQAPVVQQPAVQAPTAMVPNQGDPLVDAPKPGDPLMQGWQLDQAHKKHLPRNKGEQVDFTRQTDNAGIIDTNSRAVKRPNG